MPFCFFCDCMYFFWHGYKKKELIKTNTKTKTKKTKKVLSMFVYSERILQDTETSVKYSDNFRLNVVLREWINIGWVSVFFFCFSFLFWMSYAHIRNLCEVHKKKAKKNTSHIHRGFVCNGTLNALCQYNWFVYYPRLVAMKQELSFVTFVSCF